MNFVMDLKVRSRSQWRMESRVMDLWQNTPVIRSEALMQLHVNLGHPGVKEMIRVLKHGRASQLAVQEARCDFCAEDVQPKLPRPAILRQVVDFNERPWFGHFEFTPLVRFSQNL